VRVTVPGSSSGARPQEPRPPLPYRSQDVAYRNGEVTLAGTLTLPAAPGPYTALLFVTGSGPQDRDETMFGHRPFLVLADALTRVGYAVLRVDDRGVGGSTGDLAGSDFDDLTGDIAAGVGFLTSRPDVLRVGLLGHSEGGFLAPLVALRAEVAFVVLMAGPAVPGGQVLEAQNRFMLEAAGLPPGVVDAQLGAIRKVLGQLRAEDYGGAAASAREMFSAQGLPAEQLEAQVAQVTSRNLRASVMYDPAPALKALTVPVLAVYGGNDRLVSAEQSVPALQALFADHQDATIRLVPGLNHLMQPGTTGQLSEYTATETTVSQDVLDLLTGWLQARFPPR